MSGVAVRPLAVGDLIRDNDPRMAARPALVITGFVGISPCVRFIASLPGCGGKSETRIARERIHLDGKPRRSGWSRVSP